MIDLEVPLADGRGYPVVVGRGARHRLREVLPRGVRRAVVITQEGIALDVDPGVEHTVITIGDGEEHKHLGTIEGLCRRFADLGLTRRDCVIGVGGGLVTDVAGFAAAVFHRGIPVVHIATSLLGMVDAAIGGKTGVNLAAAGDSVGGKNLIGAFWQPSAVLCDLEALDTLPPRELRSGRGEMAKYAWLGVDGLRDLPLEEAVAACVRLKAAVVAQDEREGVGEGGALGRRALLNYGHTLAHALEIDGNHALTHGEAVAIGLVFAARLAHRMGRIDADRVAQHRALNAAYDLPLDIPATHAVDRLVALMAKDKKAVDGLVFILDGPRGCEVVPGVDPAVVRSVLAEAFLPATSGAAPTDAVEGSAP